MNLNGSRVDFIELKFKISFMARVSLFITLASLASGFFLYGYYSKELGSAYSDVFLTIIRINRILGFVISATLLISFLFLSIAIIILTLFVSHKIAGPIYGLERVLSEIGHKNFLHKEFSLRRNDQIKALGLICVRIAAFFGEKIGSIKKKIIYVSSEFEKIDHLMQQKGSDKNELIGYLNKLIEETEHIVIIIDSDIKLRE